MLSLHPFVPAAPCEGTNNILTQQFENHILAKKASWDVHFLPYWIIGKKNYSETKIWALMG